MKVAASEPLAMVLPLPVPAASAEDAVRFVSLEGYRDVFVDLKTAFPETTLFAQPLGMGRGPVANRAVLQVHQVGAFDASFVPRIADFERLDPRFRLPPAVLGALPRYHDWGFAVFQLSPTKQAEVHPMALVFPRREPRSLFFPTTHVHDGNVPASAMFDHALYAQFPPLVGELSNWTPSHAALGGYVDANKVAGLVEPARKGHATALLGNLVNADVWLHPPDDVTLEDMSGKGESYAYKVKATYFYAQHSHQMYPKWRDTSATKLPELCAGIRAGLEELTRRNARAWQLGPINTTFDAWFMNGNQLWIGTDYRNGQFVAEPLGRGRVTFRPFGQLVEQQEITLAFATLPSQDDARDINQELCRMLDRAVS